MKQTLVKAKTADGCAGNLHGRIVSSVTHCMGIEIIGGRSRPVMHQTLNLIFGRFDSFSPSISAWIDK